MIITAEYLAQYIYLESELKRIKRKLEYYKKNPLTAEHGVVKASMELFPFAECHIVVSGPNIKLDAERKATIKQLTYNLIGNQRLYEDMKLDIELFIETVKDLEMKSILSKKYVENWTDEKIGNELGYERSTITKKIDRFFEVK